MLTVNQVAISDVFFQIIRFCKCLELRSCWNHSFEVLRNRVLTSFVS